MILEFPWFIILLLLHKGITRSFRVSQDFFLQNFSKRGILRERNGQIKHTLCKRLTLQTKHTITSYIIVPVLSIVICQLQLSVVA